MKKQDAMKHFGGASKLASALNIAPAAVSQWGENVPLGRAYQIELMTKGKLKAQKQEFKKAS